VTSTTTAPPAPTTTTTVPTLPKTGSSTAPQIALGLGLLAAGSLLVASSRRQQRA
jgi:LPXTG-motif cell wall-anchored protein